MEQIRQPVHLWRMKSGISGRRITLLSYFQNPRRPSLTVVCPGDAVFNSSIILDQYDTSSSWFAVSGFERPLIKLNISLAHLLTTPDPDWRMRMPFLISPAMHLFTELSMTEKEESPLPCPIVFNNDRSIFSHKSRLPWPFKDAVCRYLNLRA